MKDYKYVPPPAAADETPDESGVTPSMLDFDFARDVEPQVCNPLLMTQRDRDH